MGPERAFVVPDDPLADHERRDAGAALVDATREVVPENGGATSSILTTSGGPYRVCTAALIPGP
ncbi:hypothetical protein [Cryobacterium algoritolerans]|uniref:hypothetical protein n=1 Tax=Cryobacterium algoritolerans TaxID=1259184 RepID=UPI0018E08E1B|nr:hypothetical protein [Cryobacterium algoritolerans]